MARKTLLTRDDFLEFLPKETKKLENATKNREVYCFTTYKGDQGIIGFVDDEPLPQLETYYISEAMAAQSAQAFLSAAA